MEAQRTERSGHVAVGKAFTVLEEYATPSPGFYLYYPLRRQAPPSLRALIDYVLR